jgi:hypothetical protein
MSLTRIIVGAAAVAFIAGAIPAAAHAQGAWKTACKDGTTTSATGANACDGHGGIHHLNSAIEHHRPSSSTKSAPERVTQAGTPAPAAKPHYEERRGWRWGRHHEEQRREEKREERRDEKHRRVRCRDGKYEKEVGKGHEVCKHHGGLAH